MPPNSVYLVLEIMPNANLLLLQKEMQKRFVRGQTASSIRFLPWSKNTWLYGHLLEPAPLESLNGNPLFDGRVGVRLMRQVDWTC